MKFNKIAKKFAAAALAGVLAVSMMGMSVSADNPVASDGETSVSSISFTKTVLTDGNTYAPNTTFTFKVESGDAGTFEDSSGHTYTVTAGPEGGLTASNVTFAPNTSEGSSTLSSYSQTGTLTVVESVFTSAGEGVYHYTMKENATDYEGITIDTAVYDIYVFVYNKTDMSGYYVAYVLVQKRGADAKSGALEFTNDYGADNNLDSTHDVTVTKKITGTAADTSDTFSFTVKVTSSETSVTEVYKVVYTNENGTKTYTTYVESGDAGITVSGIGQNDTITIYGLTKTDVYTITENDGISQGYDADGSVTGSATSDNTTATITNNKNFTTPTGIALSIAPYVLMVAFAGVIAVMFLRKRNYEI